MEYMQKYVKEQGDTSLCNVNNRRKVPITQEQKSQLKRQEQLGVSSQGARDLPQGLAEGEFASSDRTRRLDVLAAGNSTSTRGGAQDSTLTGSTRHADRSINSSMSASRSAR